MGEHEGSATRGPYGVPPCDAARDSVDRVLVGWAVERPDLDFTPVGVVSRLARVRSHLEAGLSSVFADFGLTPADFEVVVSLRRAGRPFRMPQARLMDALGLTSGTVSVRLDRLEKNGVVVREADPGNARSVLVRLTDHGVALFDAAAPAHLANEDLLLSALGETERQQLGDLLRRLLSSFERGHADVAGHLGLRVEPAPVARRRRAAVGLSDVGGLLVAAVGADSPAARAGVLRGDLLTGISGCPTLNTVALAEALEGVEPGQPAQLDVLRGDLALTIAVTVPDAGAGAAPALR